MPKAKLAPLGIDQLANHCNLKKLPFKSSDDLEELSDIVGQDRALEAIRFGLGIAHKGFNLYLMGPEGMGKHSIIRRFLQQDSSDKPSQDDWIYVHDYDQSHLPRAIKLAHGEGAKLQKDMEQFIKEVGSTLVTTFEGEEFRNQVQEIESELKDRQELAFNELSEQASAHKIRLFRTPSGFAFAPLSGEEGSDEVIDSEEFASLPEERQEEVESLIETLQEQLQQLLQQIPKWRREVRDKVRQHGRKMTDQVVEQLMEEFHSHYEHQPRVSEYLQRTRKDIVENVRLFLNKDESDEGAEERDPLSLQRYKINNLLVRSERDQTGVPIVYLDNPTYHNLVGRTEHLSRMGSLLTDFTLLKPGALHRANGGYLILDAHKLLGQPYAWEGLKRALNAGEIKIETPEQMLNLGSTVTLEPEVIPLSVKVILMGDRHLYYQLHDLDPEFCELFRVQVDFEEDLPRSEQNIMLLSRLIASVVRKESLLPIERSGIAEIIDFASRQVEDRDKISIHMRSIADLLREADFHTRSLNKRRIRRAEIRHAIQQQIYRASRLQEHIVESIERGTTLIECQGETMGQVNGLSVISMGDHSFGQPSRITATTHIGEGSVIDIEREVELGGSLHSKGVMIISSYLGACFAQKIPLSLSASLAFEQSYGEVDGDSASMAEYCALLSSLAELPVRQSLAITGSMNQRGEAQPIGGVNQKIEGFFDICSIKGLTGEQGVIIPETNIKNLMLAPRVIDAVKGGKFAIYSVGHVREAQELLLGLPAGTVNRKGEYPNGTVGARVQKRLVLMSQRKHAASGHEHEE